MTLATTDWIPQLRLTYIKHLLAHLRTLPSTERIAELAAHLDACSPSDWLRLLGAAWTDLSRIAGWEEFLLTRSPLGAAPWPVIEMMDADELAAFEALPDEFLAYRGALAHNHAGLCWCLDMGQAAAYADHYATQLMQCAHLCPTAYRLTVRVDKSHVIAVKRSGCGLTLLVAQVDYLDTEVLSTSRPANAHAAGG